MIWRNLAVLMVTGVLAAEQLPPDQVPNEEGAVVVLTVRGAVNRALAANPTLLGAQESLTAAELQKSLQEGPFDTSWQPACQCAGSSDGLHLGLGLNLTRNLPVGTSISALPKLTRKGGVYTSDCHFSLKQPLLRGSFPELNWHPLRTAEFSVRSQQRTFAMTQQRTALSAIQALYRLAACETHAQLEQAWCEHLQRFVEAMRLKSDIGVASANDLFKAQIELRKGEEKRARAEQKLDRARQALHSQLALPSHLCLQAEAPLMAEVEAIEEKEAIGIALDQRFEVEQVADQLAEAQRKARIARHKLSPELNLVYHHSRDGWNVGLTTDTDFSRHAERVAFQQSLMQVDAAQRAIDETEQLIEREVRGALSLLEHVQARVLAGIERGRSAEGKFRLTQLRFDRGLAGSFDLMQAEKGVKESQEELLDAAVERALGQFELLAVQGILLEPGAI